MTETALRPAVIALASGLREARTRRGIALRRLADMADLHPGVLSSYELGQRTPPDTTVAHILGVLREPHAVRDQLIELVRRAHDRDFIDHTGNDEDLLRTAYEQRSTGVTEWSPSLIPEALQTADYARALRTAGLVATDAIDERCLIRTARQLTLPDQTGPQFTFLIGESATCPVTCTSDVLDRQLDELRIWTRRPRIAVRVVPTIDCPPGLVEPFTLYEHGAGAFAVAVRHHQGAVYLTHETALTNYRNTARSLRSLATENTSS
jgi:transcriptional regulator with XRE-family HTH domain